MGAASIVIQVQRLISNWKALQPVPSQQVWEVELQLVWEPERVGDRSLLTRKVVRQVRVGFQVRGTMQRGRKAELGTGLLPRT